MLFNNVYPVSGTEFQRGREDIQPLLLVKGDTISVVFPQSFVMKIM